MNINATYQNKLLSPLWQKKRLEIMNRDGFRCQICKSENKTLHVHHKRYFYGLNPWEYENIHLITLCEDCHKNIHIPLKHKSEKEIERPFQWRYKNSQYNFNLESRKMIYNCEALSQIIYTLLGSFDYKFSKYYNWITREEYVQITHASYNCEYRNNKLSSIFSYGFNSGNGYQIFLNVKKILTKMVKEQKNFEIPDFEIPDFDLIAYNLNHISISWEDTIMNSDFVIDMNYFNKEKLVGYGL